MSTPPAPGAGPPLVDVLVTVPADSRLDEAGRASGQGLAACLACYRIEWQGAEAAADGRQRWRFRAPDAESVRIALRHAAIPFEALSVSRP